MLLAAISKEVEFVPTEIMSIMTAWVMLWPMGYKEMVSGQQVGEASTWLVHELELHVMKIPMIYH